MKHDVDFVLPLQQPNGRLINRRWRKNAQRVPDSRRSIRILWYGAALFTAIFWSYFASLFH